MDGHVPNQHGYVANAQNSEARSFSGNILKFVLDLSYALVASIILWIVAIVKFFLPTSWIGKDIRGSTVLITGAGGGIGGLLAKRFASLGCHLILWDVNEEMNNATAQSVKDKGVKVFTYTVDLSNRESIYTMAQKVHSEVDRVDIVVNNAGFVAGKKALEANDKQMQLTMDVNALSHFWMAKAFLKPMVRRNSGHLVTVASGAGLIGTPGMADYCASKFAAVGFQEALRQELDCMEDNDVKTTMVCPFLIKTAMFSGCYAKYPFLLDGLEPEYVADKIINAILRNQEFLCLPRMVYLLYVLKTVMPIRVMKVFADFAGSTTLMDTFLGRHKKSQ